MLPRVFRFGPIALAIGTLMVSACGGDGGGATSDANGGGQDGGNPTGDPDASSGGPGTDGGGGTETGAPDPNPARLLTADAIDQLQAFGAHGFARVTEATHGREEWGTDFTIAGTALLVDSCTGACAGEPSNVVATSGGASVFLAHSTLYGTNGTPGGTTGLGSGGLPLVAAGSKAVYSSGVTTAGASDGTTGGTSTLKDLSPANFDGVDGIAIGGRALFTMSGGAGAPTERDIFGTDGTAAGTVQVATVTSSSSSFFYLHAAGHIGVIETIFFSPGSFIGTTTLRVTDGTVAGTKSLPGTFADEILSPAAVGDALYFTGKTYPSGNTPAYALYKADASTITKVVDGHISVVDVGGLAYFVTAATKIQKTDGTTPVDVYDASPGYPSSLTAVGTTLYFLTGADLWKLEGTPPVATKLVTFSGDCPTCSGSATAGATLEAAGNRIFALRSFHEPDATPRPSVLWVSDGTSAGTKLLKASGVVEFVGTDTGVLWTNGKELWHERP